MTMQDVFPHRITPPQPGRQRNALRIETIEPQPRCRLRPRTEAAGWTVEHRPFHVADFWSQFGYCQGGAKSCADCTRAKVDPYAPQAIEAGDTVRTTRDELHTVESFETRQGFRTGYVFLATPTGSRRVKLADITLHMKAADYRSGQRA